MSSVGAVFKVVMLLVAAILLNVASTQPRSSSPQETKRVYTASLFERAIKSWVYLLRASFGVICIFPAIALSAHTYNWNSDSAAHVINALCPNPPTPFATSSITSAWCLGWATAVGGSSLRIWCYKKLASLFTFQVMVQKEHKLVTTGPYAAVRHPSYTGFYFMLVGVLLLTFGSGGYFAACGIMSTPARWAVYAWLALVLYFGVSVWKRIGGEEAMLTEAFGDEWLRYRQRVSYRLLRGVI